MKYENKILEIATSNNGIVTTKEVSKNKIARIYLTKLIKEKKLFRIERGIYSTSKTTLDSYYSLQNKSKKIIFSHFTSLKIQGYYKNIDTIDQLSVMQGYNAKKFKNYKVFYNSKSNYEKGIIKFKYKGHTLKIYDLERSVCDIIKDRNRFEQLEYNKFINYYFNKIDLNYKKLLEYSKALRISKLVHHYLSLFKA